MLEVDVACRLGALSLDVAFTAGRGVTGLFGRSGAGKTTVVNAVAGLLRPDRGRIVLDGEPSARHRARASTCRAIADASATSSRTRACSRTSPCAATCSTAAGSPAGAGRGAALDEVVDLLGIDPLLDAPARHTLGRREAAGGDRARAARRARACCCSTSRWPRSTQARKAEILPYLERLCREARVPILFVSHALEEVTRLATGMVLLAAGTVVAAGPVGEVLARLDLGSAANDLGGGALLHLQVVGRNERHGLTVLDPSRRRDRGARRSTCR